MSKLEEVSHEMLALLLPRVSSRVSGFPVASPCLWGSCNTSPFRRCSSRLSCRFAWQAWHFVTFQPVLYIPDSRLYTPNSPLYTPHFTLSTLHFTLYTLHSTLCTVHSSLHTSHSTLHTPHFTLHTAYFTLHTPHSTFYTSHSTLHTLHFTLHTPHSTLYTLHFTLHTPHSACLQKEEHVLGRASILHKPARHIHADEHGCDCKVDSNNHCWKRLAFFDPMAHGIDSRNKEKEAGKEAGKETGKRRKQRREERRREEEKKHEII